MYFYIKPGIYIAFSFWRRKSFLNGHNFEMPLIHSSRGQFREKLWAETVEMSKYG